MSPAPRPLNRVLVVEDNAPLLAAIARRVRSWGAVPLEAGTVRAARRLLSPPPDLVIADVRLPDEPAFALLEEVSQLWPRPLVVAISGRASAQEAFKLAQLGAQAYLSKPLSLRGLEEAVQGARQEPPALDSLVTACVGRLSMREVQEEVRRKMMRQALALSEGSRSGAARLLDVSRQAVQQMLRASDAVRDRSSTGRDDRDAADAPTAPASTPE